MKISNLEIQDNFVLSSSAKFDKSTEEISENLLDLILADVANEPDCGRVYLNEATFLFIFLNKISIKGKIYLDEFLIFGEGWQLLVLELASLVELLIN